MNAVRTGFEIREGSRMIADRIRRARTVVAVDRGPAGTRPLGDGERVGERPDPLLRGVGQGGVNYPAQARQRARLAAVEYADSQQGVVRCARCGRRVWKGTFGAGRVAFRRHRDECKAAA